MCVLHGWSVDTESGPGEAEAAWLAVAGGLIQARGEGLWQAATPLGHLFGKAWDLDGMFEKTRRVGLKIWDWFSDTWRPDGWEKEVDIMF